ncbi:NAD(P)/FAD-dependent oxidoreductase [Lactobacillus sp. ESL0785]|uniref:NAD(P)/FAD-dependent oxidoreductase n=1 Tax=Lactobacillus sp. ESL0785 TaxID=2983232 RepID=UPI0023F6AB88|nr:NAD(P)/FAD-dependent oxidoreductase [Lactobacillus sp. ESL0785]WEV71235.1 NAD(P)/FAD-dependent oxidoreductase [Lactobacillus sp. ESL0785]
MRGVFKIKKFDIAIIGAGPIGLFAANFAHLHGLKTIVFDSLEEVGGQPKLLYPFKKIFDIPVFASITGRNLITQLKLQAEKNASFSLNHRVSEINHDDDHFLIDHEFLVKSVIIATGTGSFSPKKFPLKMDKEQTKHVHYYIREPKKFAKQTIGVFGGGDSALDWALELAQQPDTQIKLIHRRNEFRGLEGSLTQLKSLKNVEILTPYLPKTLQLVNNQLSIGLKQVGTTTINQQIFDQIVVAYGFRANNNFVRKWGVNLSGGQITVSSEMKTNIPGIYAIGDATTYPGRVPVIGLGFGEAQIAITSIMRSLFPEKTLTIHSTSI